MKTLIMNNVIPKEKLREIQENTLNELADILSNSFGPNGSNACIKKENALSRYSKDGHTIIGSLHYNGIIEQSIKDDIESITRHIVKTVGDGTTSAVILSSLIFKCIKDVEDSGSYKPVEIVTALEKVVSDLKKKIKSTAREITDKDIYDITMISTNGNVDIANMLVDIYNEFGKTVFIDVSPSTGEEMVIKSYNGMTLNTGYDDACFVTDATKNISEVDKPEVYFFEDPIDTREIGVYLDSIISHNFITPANAQNWDAIRPTVIFAPKISRDMSSTMNSLISTMASMPVENRLPICIITDLHETEQLKDLAKLCGARMIHKYIDKGVYEADVAAGRAPTPETIFNFAGRCDKVIAYSSKTTFIRPALMYKEDGSYSEMYNNLHAFLKSEIIRETADGGDARTIGTLKRRLHSLEANMVELFVGGITQADRDSLRDLVEDAVLNLRSAAENGVGYAANMSAVIAISSVDISKYNDLERSIFTAIAEAYEALVCRLYEVTEYARCIKNEGSTNADLYANIVNNAIKDGLIYNIREEKWSDNVVTSIMSDVTILDTVSRIIGIMATCNQFILPTAMHNVYMD